MGFRKCKCFYCNEKIENEEDRVKLKITEKSEKNFHKKCVEAFQLKRSKDLEENNKWNELYEYIKSNILNYSKNTQLTPNMINKLKSLRNGTLVRNGDKVSSDGYDYEVILTTFKLKKQDILNSIFGKSFNDDNHKFNYIMVIIKNNINEVQKRFENAKLLKEKEINIVANLNNVKSIENQLDDFKRIKKTKEKNKVAELFQNI